MHLQVLCIWWSCISRPYCISGCCQIACCCLDKSPRPQFWEWLQTCLLLLLSSILLNSSGHLPQKIEVNKNPLFLLITSVPLKSLFIFRLVGKLHQRTLKCPLITNNKSGNKFMEWQIFWRTKKLLDQQKWVLGTCIRIYYCNLK